jgi:hypothetical protein
MYKHKFVDLRDGQSKKETKISHRSSYNAISGNASNARIVQIPFFINPTCWLVASVSAAATALGVDSAVAFQILLACLFIRGKIMPVPRVFDASCLGSEHFAPGNVLRVPRSQLSHALPPREDHRCHLLK